MYNTINQPFTSEQLSAIEKYAHTHSIEILKVYTDFFRDRIHDQKPGLLAMMEDAETQKFDAVLVYNATCVIREPHELLFLEQELLDNDIVLISIENKMSLNAQRQSTQSIMFEGLIEGMSEYYSRNLGIKISQELR